MAELSKATGIERFALSRYANGKRVPSKPETVETIADALQMTNSEKEAFLEAFDKDFYGESMVNSYNYMKNFFNSLNSLNSESYVSELVGADDEGNLSFHLINSRYDVVSCVLKLFEEVARGSNTAESTIRILVSNRSACKEIQGDILSVLRGTDICIQQIVGLEGNVNKCYMNIETLQDILPVSFAVENYHVYYYYVSLLDQNKGITMFPNMISVGGTVILLDDDVQRGVMTNNSEMLDFCNSRFDELAAKCSPLIEKCDDIGGYFGTLYPTDLYTYENNNVYLVYRYPCIAYATTHELLLRYIKDVPGKQQFIDMYTQSHGYFEGDTFINPSGEKHHLINITTKEGLWEQMREGTCAELPSEWYEHMPLDVMQGFLKRMIILMKSGFLEYRFLKTDLSLPKNIQFFCLDLVKEVRFMDTGTFAINQVKLHENSVFSAYHLFIDYLEAKKILLTKEESLAYMEEVYRKIDSELKSRLNE